MPLDKWLWRFILAAIVLAGVLACRTTDMFVAQKASATSTRTPRATFTAMPSPTLTPVPIPTNPPPPPTTAPTRRPTARPTPRPPTAPPPPAATAPPPPTAFPWTYHANPAGCAHAGNTYIKGSVYASSDPSSGKVPGQPMALGGADGSSVWVTVKTDDGGEYTFTLSAPGGGAKVGTFYVWVIDSNGNRISEIGGPIVTNNLGPDAPGTCWNGWVDFWK